MPKKGYKQSPEHIAKLQKIRKGKNLGKDNPFWGQKHSEETRAIIRLKRAQQVFSVESIQKRALANSGEKNGMWKGDKVGYFALHDWVERKLGKSNYCEYCGLIQIKGGKKQWFQWANISHEYKRNTNDWIRLCVKCHKAYDIRKDINIVNFINLWVERKNNLNQ
jgi:hypothetical protein